MLRTLLLWRAGLSGRITRSALATIGLIVISLVLPHVMVAQNRADGTVGATSILYASASATGQQPESIVTADFNADGIADLAVANAVDNTISIFLGNGDGTFQPPVDYELSEGQGSTIQVVTADLNGDGKADLIVVNGGLSVFLGNGDGTFQNSSEQESYSAIAVAVGDVNGDGIPDLVLALSSDLQEQPSPGSAVMVLDGIGDGTFNSEGETYPLAGVVAVDLADLNGDGLLD